MNHQPSSPGGKRTVNGNLSKGLKVEILLKIYIISLLFVNVNVVKQNEQVKLYL